MSNPLVSLCVPTYNSARFLRETLDSLVAQSYDHLEVIIADNASSDESVAIAREYAARHGFRVITNSVNSGPFTNWNRMLELAQGDYVAIYHSDDLYDPAIVAESVALLEREPSAGLVGTLATAIDEQGAVLYPVQLPGGVPPSPLYGFDEAFRGALGGGGDRIFLVTPSVMVRRSLYQELGMFDTSGRFASAGDYEMWLRIARRSSVAVIPRPLMRYRIHQGQGSERELRRNVALPDILTVLDAYVGFVGNAAVRAAYERYRQRACLKTALKQNCKGEYDRCRESTALIRSGRYLLPALVLAVACRFRLNLRCWPCRSWPCRFPAGEG